MMDQENKEDREWMVKYWSDYIRTHPDKDWSEKQRIFIDSLFPE